MAKFKKHDQPPRTEGNEQGQGGEQGAPQFAGDTTAASPERDRLASRAYELYQARGGGDGMDMEDWLAAERELTQQRSRPDNSES